MPAKRRARRSSRSRTIGYRVEGDIVDYEGAMGLLQQALDRGIVTEFDGTKSSQRGMDLIWFNGPPGAPMRSLRDQLAALARPR